MAKSSVKGKKRITFELHAEPDSEVFVAGTFNDWNPSEKQLRYKDGVYTAMLFLPKGRHEYKFVVDGIWCVDPECPDWVPNDVGSLNSVINVE